MSMSNQNTPICFQSDLLFKAILTSVYVLMSRKGKRNNVLIIDLIGVYNYIVS